MNYPDWQPATSLAGETSANLSQHVGWRLYLRRHNTPQVANIAILAHLRTVVAFIPVFSNIFKRTTKRRSRSFESLLRLSAETFRIRSAASKFRFKIKFSPVRSIVRAASDSHCNPCCQQRIGNSHRSVAVRIRSRKGSSSPISSAQRIISSESVMLIAPSPFTSPAKHAAAGSLPQCSAAGSLKRICRSKNQPTKPAPDASAV